MRLFQCSRDSTIRSFYARACAHGTVPVEHAERAPPFGTRKSSRAAHTLFFFCPHLSALYAPRCGNAGGARRACAPVRHSQKQPCCALSLFHLCSLFCACGVGSGARFSPVEHAERAPPFGTRKNALRRWRCSIFFLMPALVQARRMRKSAWSMSVRWECLAALPPTGTRKSALRLRRGTCLFPMPARASTAGIGKTPALLTERGAFARWCRWSDSNRHGFYSTGF